MDTSTGYLRVAARAALALTLVFVGVGVERVDAGGRAGGESHLTCKRLERFNSDHFRQQPTIDNTFLPLVPGTQRVFEGDVDGTPHRVTFTVTDLTKKIDGVQSLVIWDVDESEGVVAEAELAFFAQDRAGNVWNLGEYPEEFDDGKFDGAPSTWIAGEKRAEAGIHMSPEPEVDSAFYLQGVAPAIEFLDCAKVVEMDATVDLATRHFEGVLVTNETDPNVAEDGIQIKYHAPGIGIVKIGFEVPGAAPETLEMVSFRRLSPSEMARARSAAQRLDRRGYRHSAVYRATGPVERLGRG
jgi:hypothetical protein